MVARAAIPEIYGIKEALKELNDFDNKYRREVTKQIGGAGQQIISEARSLVAHFDNSKQNGAPLSGMVRGNLIKGRNTSWKTDQVQKAELIESLIPFENISESIVLVSFK